MKRDTVPEAQPGYRPPAPRGLFDLLDSALQTRPDAVATGTGDRRTILSYSDLARAIEDVTRTLRDRGIKHGDTVGIVADNAVEIVVTLLGIVAIGAAAAPVNPHLAGSEIAKTLAAVRARAGIVPTHLRAQVAGSVPDDKLWTIALGTGGPLVTFSGGAGARSSDGSPEVQRPGPEDIALVMLTGGTTDAPKVVPLSHANVAASIRGICATYELDAGDATLLIMPLSHGHGLIAGLLATLASGGAAILPDARRFSASTFWPEMRSASATWYTAVPTMHQILLDRAAAEYPVDHPSPLRFIRSCSAPIAPTVAAAVESTFHAPLIDAYGMTETSHQVASNPLPGRGPRKSSSVGVATGVALRVVASDGASASPGALGEVQVKGPTVMAGYLDAPHVNASAFVDGWFRTGDLGFLDEDGYLFLKGRIKELINRGGEKIFPADVDAVLLSDPRVREAASFGVPDAKYGEEIHAAVVLEPGRTATAAELHDYCARFLGAFESPKVFVFVSQLPKTEKGAVDRRKLAETWGSPGTSGT